MARIDSVNDRIALQAANSSPPDPAGRRLRNEASPPQAASEARALSTASVGPSEQRAQTTELQQSAAKVQRMLAKAAPNLVFSVDEGSGRTVIKVVDPETHEVLRQIPAEEILRMDKNLDLMIARLKGLLIDRQG